MAAMNRSGTTHSLAKYLALAALIFGGALLGAGNAVHGLSGSSQPAEQHQGHHAHHGAADAALPDILSMPAHCMFCIDGIAPQPAMLPEVVLAALCTARFNVPAGPVCRSPASHPRSFLSRAPPSI